MKNICQNLIIGIWLTALFLGLPATSRGDDAELRKEIESLRQQNNQLQQKLQQQKEMIEQISRKVSGLQTTNEQHEAQWQALKTETPPVEKEPAKEDKGFSLGNVRLGAEGGIGIFESQKNGPNAKTGFRLDEIRLHMETPIFEDVYFYGEINAITREAYEDQLTLSGNLGEIYLDFENVAKFWKNERLINVRLGRFYIPFGEEYQVRNAIDNPLISHSVGDLWGLDEGIELYGSAGKFSYAVAVQNGNYQVLNDGDSDKSVAARISYDPTKRVHLSASAMRTGQLDANMAGPDGFSALWIGNGFFMALNPAATKFHANLAEVDAQYKWSKGHVKAAGGYADYNETIPAARDQRDIYYYYVEVVQNLTPKLFAAGRFSEMIAPQGYPMAGNSTIFAPTRDLWRLSLGLGYRWNKHFLLKGEYSLEEGRQISGGNRNHEDGFAAEAAFKF